MSLVVAEEEEQEEGMLRGFNGSVSGLEHVTAKCGRNYLRKIVYYWVEEGPCKSTEGSMKRINLRATSYKNSVSP
jgi:hypothetical protein